MVSGELLPLAGSLNLMADRLIRFEQVDQRTQKLSRALAELSSTLERYRVGTRFVVPASCSEFPEIHRLLLAMGLRQAMSMSDARQTSQPLGNRPLSQELTPASPQLSGGRPPSQALTPRNGLAPVTPMPDQPNNPRRTSQLLPDVWDVEASERG